MLVTSKPRNAAIFHTQLGWMAILGSGKVLSRLHFGATSQDEAGRRIHDEFAGEVAFSDWNPDLRERLRSYAEKGTDDFLDVEVEVSDLTDFARRVLAKCRQIPPGETTTYGKLAASVGSAGAARAVGSVMARNRVPIVIPCHRVVGRDGNLTGFSAPGGCDMKQRMLDLEAAFRVLGVPSERCCDGLYKPSSHC